MMKRCFKPEGLQKVLRDNHALLPHPSTLCDCMLWLGCQPDSYEEEKEEMEGKKETVL